MILYNVICWISTQRCDVCAPRHCGLRVRFLIYIFGKSEKCRWNILECIPLPFNESLWNHCVMLLPLTINFSKPVYPQCQLTMATTTPTPNPTPDHPNPIPQHIHTNTLTTFHSKYYHNHLNTRMCLVVQNWSEFISVTYSTQQVLRGGQERNITPLILGKNSVTKTSCSGRGRRSADVGNKTGGM